MTSRSRFALGLVSALWVTAIAAPTVAAPASPASTAAAGAPEPIRSHGSEPIIPLGEVRAGMKGYGLTVFQGTRPERFDVQVIGVLHNFLPKQDIILIRSDDPRLLHSGIVAGMSGSPIYLQGRLAGALAYGWAFAKDPIAGVTPIESMMKELERPLRGRAATPMAEAALEPSRRRSLDDVIASREKRQREEHPLLSRFPLPAPLLDGAEPRLQRASVPLSLAGFGASAFAAFEDALKPFHMTPLQ